MISQDIDLIAQKATIYSITDYFNRIYCICQFFLDMNKIFVII